MPTVLVVTGQLGAGEVAGQGLASAGYDMIPVATVDAALRTLLMVQVDAIVVDVAIGEGPVQELCGFLQSNPQTEGLPLLFLAPATLRWLPDALPLRLGFDELVVKPFTGAQIRQALERMLSAATRPGPNVLTLGNLLLDRTTQELRCHEGALPLTPTEFRLLDYLAQRQGWIVSTAELLEQVWGFYPGTGSSELVRAHIRNLRTKVRQLAQGREVIHTVPRRGYKVE